MKYLLDFPLPFLFFPYNTSKAFESRKHETMLEEEMSCHSEETQNHKI